MKVSRFEDLECWKEARTLTKMIYQEVQSHLYVALDAGHLKQDEFDSLYAQAGKSARLTSGFINYLRRGAPTS